MKTNGLTKFFTGLIVVLFFSCDNKFEESLELKEPNGIEVSRGTLESFPQVSELYQIAVTDQKGKSNSGKGGIYDFEIVSTIVSKINHENNEYYSFPITRKENEEGTFENLIIANKEDAEPKAYVLKYYPDQNYLERAKKDPFTHFSGQQSIGILDYNTLITSRGGCFTVTEVRCSSEGHPYPTPLAGPGCTQPYTVTYVVCLDAGDSSGGGSGSTDGYSSGGGTGGASGRLGSGGSNGNLTSDILTEPLFLKNINPHVYLINQLGYSYSSPEAQYLRRDSEFEEKIQRLLSSPSRALAKDAIDLRLDVAKLDGFLRQEQFDPLDSPWLKRAREIAEKIFEKLEQAPDYIKEELIEAIDQSFVFALNETALKLNPNANTNSESQKQSQFKNNGKNGVGILLYEFANGQGEDVRVFPFDFDMTKQMLAGNVPRDIKSNFFESLEEEGLTYEGFIQNGNTINGGYAFSPDHTTIKDSFNKHKNANWVQFFIGGASTKYSPSNEENWIIVEMSNGTSRSSLMARLAEDYPRDGSGNNRPLSTIKQKFVFKLKVR